MTNSPNTPAPTAAFDSEGFRAWVRANLPDDTIIGSSAWWADHLTAWAERFAKEASKADRASPAKPAVAGLPPLPEATGMKWRRQNTDSVGAYFEDPRKFGINMEHPEYEWTPLYTASQLQQYGEQCRMAAAPQQQDTQQGEK